MRTCNLDLDARGGINMAKLFKYCSFIWAVIQFVKLTGFQLNLAIVENCLNSPQVFINFFLQLWCHEKSPNLLKGRPSLCTAESEVVERLRKLITWSAKEGWVETVAVVLLILQMLSLLEHMYHELGLVKEFNMNGVTLKRWLVWVTLLYNNRVHPVWLRLISPSDDTDILPSHYPCSNSSQSLTKNSDSFLVTNQKHLTAHFNLIIMWNLFFCCLHLFPCVWLTRVMLSDVQPSFIIHNSWWDLFCINHHKYTIISVPPHLSDDI